MLSGALTLNRLWSNYTLSYSLAKCLSQTFSNLFLSLSLRLPVAGSLS
jgi:hypothetical protein